MNNDSLTEMNENKKQIISKIDGFLDSMRWTEDIRGVTSNVVPYETLDSIDLGWEILRELLDEPISSVIHKSKKYRNLDDDWEISANQNV